MIVCPISCVPMPSHPSNLTSSQVFPFVRACRRMAAGTAPRFGNGIHVTCAQLDGMTKTYGFDPPTDGIPYGSSPATFDHCSVLRTAMVTGAKRTWNWLE